MPFTIQVKIVPASNNKFTETENQNVYTSKQCIQTASDHNVISSESSIEYDKK